ncbi:hypothetical protein PG985_014969 [Apiospora marii]|uniref:uncharacterized protein n=1 Tax=Apiospora marii TaxID=335849 RepID=UPI00312D613F
MDLFQRLPPELRIMILERISSRRAMSQLIQASPAMLEQYLTSKQKFTRALLAADLDEEMIQDAMAIILYPSHMYPTVHSSDLVQGYLFASWASKRLPNPLRKPAESQNARFIRDLGKLHGRLVFFIEDYLTKATAVFPPREYVCLPALSPMQTHTTFKGKPVSPVFDVACLTGGERSRLLKAFLRHHLMTLVYRDWDWYLRSRHCYRKELFQYDGRDFQPFEQEGIFCVREYLESLYGTIFAHLGDSWLPEIAPNPPSSGLRYPDNVFFDPQDYVNDFTPQSIFLDIATMAGFGFDLAWILLRAAIAGRQEQEQLGKWFQKSCPERYSTFDWSKSVRWTALSPAIGIHGSYRDHQEGPGMYRKLYSHFKPGDSLIRHIYRQRAWAFLDDARFYPSSPGKPHFPIYITLERITDEAWVPEGWSLRPAQARAMRRSQKWHDEQFPPSRFEASPREIDQGSEPETESNASLPDVVNGHFRISQPFWL